MGPKPDQEMSSNELDPNCNVSNKFYENSQIHLPAIGHQTLGKDHDNL